MMQKAATVNPFEELIEFVSKAVPKATRVEKYGGILFTLKPDEKEGQFCGAFAYKTHVQLSFSQGTLLKNTTGLKLEGSGKFRRHINMESLGAIDKKSLKQLIVQSSKL